MITDEKILNKRLLKLIIITIAIITLIITIILLITNSSDKINLDLDKICNNNIYDGSSKTLSKLEKNEEYTFSNNEATEAGTYDIIITPNKGYAWSNNSKKAITIKCSIEKAQSNLTINKEDTITLNKNDNISITIDTSIEGKITINSDENILKVDKKEISKTKDQIQIKLTSVNEGKTTLKINFTPNNNNYTTEEKVININITNYKKINAPTTSICNNILYNGNTQKLVSKTDYEGYTLKGQLEGKNAGNYKIQAVLKDGYIWNDGSSNDKDITCTIKKESNYSIIVHNSSCKVGETVEFTIQSKSITQTANNNGVKSISNNQNITSITQKTKCDCVKYLGYNNQNTNICANCIYIARYEAKCNKVGEDNITINMNNGETLKTKINVNQGDTIILGTKDNSFDGIKCTVGKEINITISTYNNGNADKTRLKNYTIKNTSYASISKGETTTTTNNSETPLKIKCIKNGNTELIITSKDGTTKKFPIIY